MRLIPGPTRTASLVAVGALALAACGGDSGTLADAAETTTTTTTTVAADDHPTGDGAEELPSALRRLAIADADAARLVLIDLDDDGAEVELDLPAPASHASSVSEDGRLVLLAHDDAVTIVDGASWSEGHGDHRHHFAEAPAVVGSVDGEKPTHLISHGGTAALWFDGAGEAVLLDEGDLADGQLVEGVRVPTPAPHHGFAIPHGDHVVLTAPPAEGEEMPGQVAIANRSGEVESEHACGQTHGEASWSAGAAAACADGVLVLREDGDEWTSELIGYPSVDDEDPYGYGGARAWILEPVGDGARLVAPLGEHHVLVLDTTTGEVAAIDVGAPVAIFGVTAHDPSGRLVVLTGDGAVQLVDPAAGGVIDRVEVLDPTVEGDPDMPYRMLAVSGDDVFVSDPDGRAVVQLTIGDRGLAVGATHDLGFTPAFLGIVNG